MGTINCLMTGNYVGYQNVSYIVDEDFGGSYPGSTAFKVSAKNTLYMFESFAGTVMYCFHSTVMWCPPTLRFE